MYVTISLEYEYLYSLLLGIKRGLTVSELTSQLKVNHIIFLF